MHSIHAYSSAFHPNIKIHPIKYIIYFKKFKHLDRKPVYNIEQIKYACGLEAMKKLITNWNTKFEKIASKMSSRNVTSQCMIILYVPLHRKTTSRSF